MIKETMKGQMAVMKEYFDRSTRVLTDADSAYTPVPGMMTAAAQIAHAAQVVDWFIEGAFADAGFDLDFDPQIQKVEAVKTVSEARAWFNRACDAAMAEIDKRSDAEWMTLLPPGPIMAGVPRMAIFGALTDHTAHHRGALTVYSRLMGKVPPMPYMEM